MRALPALLLLCTPAQAWEGTQPCYPVEKATHMLASEGQEPWGAGITDKKSLIAFFVNRETMEWTAARLMTQDGKAYLCAMRLQGDGWKSTGPVPGRAL